MLAEPAKAQSSRLRKLNAPIWAYWQFAKAFVSFLSRLYNVSTLEEVDRLFARFIKRLLEIGTVLDRGLPSGRIGKPRAMGLYLASRYYERIVRLAVFAGKLRLGRLAQDDLQQVIRFGELSIAYYDAASRKAFPKPWIQRQRVRLRRRECQKRASYHVALAALYAQLGIGDLSRNLETALEHYRSAAKILEQEGSKVCALGAAKVWTTLGTVLLSYPTEHRLLYARQAKDVLSRAKEVAAPYAASMEAPPEAMKDMKARRRLSFMTMAKHVVPYLVRLRASERKASKTGIPDPILSGTTLPFFLPNVNWQLGKACRELGEIDKAIEHFTAAIEGFTGEAEVLRAPVEVDKGYAFLEAWRGNRRRNLHFAAESFRKALALCVQNGRVKKLAEMAYVRGLIGDAKLYFALDALDAINPDKRKATLPLVTKELRGAARIARKLSLPEQLQEALFLLGRIYMRQEDARKAYQAFALATRVADRSENRARRPGLMRYLVGAEAPLDDLLVRVSYVCASDSEDTPSEQTRKRKRVPLHAPFCFTERGRTVFLQTQLAGLSLRPKGASESDVEELFSRRRVWHEAELRLLEQEPSPAPDDKVLDGLRERRNMLESRYHKELEDLRQRFADPDYDPDRPTFRLRFADVHTTIQGHLRKRHMALVAYYLTSQYLLEFILLPTRLYCVRGRVSTDELKAIKERWEGGYGKLLARELSPTQWERGYLTQVLDRLKPLVEKPAEIIADWERETGLHISQITVVPHRFLHLVPFHAIPLPNGSAWGESVSIQYAPSASVLLQLLRLQDAEGVDSAPLPSARNGRKAVAISYSPRKENQQLFFNALEGRAVAEATQGVLLDGPEATPTRVKATIEDAAYIHFACHGSFDEKAPLQSALELAPQDASDGGPVDQCGRLTLAEIFQGVRLSRARLVVLSACETGLTQVEPRHEEYIGLPAGFLHAGATTVVSSLWPVADVASWLLMRFFAKRISSGWNSAEALYASQLELRVLSRDAVLQEIAAAARKEPDPLRRERMLEQGQTLQGDFPFMNAYWWAAFTVNGVGGVVMRPPKTSPSA
jgi:CHAT domain-containing protein/tetratricopeptide (TPR) repeat protein